MLHPSVAALDIDILVVDDTPENLRLLSTMLTQKGYHVRKAINGQMALTAVQALLPDLILLDIMMPGLDGFDVCKQLKANSMTADIPVIFLSALNHTPDKVAAFQAGGADYITKPFHLEEVLARVHHQLALRAATQEIRKLNACLEERVRERTQQLEVAHTQLLELALCDALTGMPNRVSFLEQLELSLHRTKVDESYRFAVLFLDCDRFKVVNDSLGHETGDELLIAIAHRLQSLLQPTDTLARMGGDEFAILLTQLSSNQQAMDFAQQTLAHFTQPFNLQHQQVFINASIGVVFGHSNYDKPEHLMRDADTAMYQAKAGGKAQYRLFDRMMHDSALKLLQLETDLRHAIQHQEFVLHYQPIIDLGSGTIYGVEALVRWQHPIRGLVPPGEFIPLAEETGLIHQIGQFVLKEACYQLLSWQQQGLVSPSFSVSVNLSACQFAQPNLTDQILAILATTQLNPQCLKLEITESAIMDNPTFAADILHKLRQHDIQLSMDDFGTGYSSLSYLSSFPMDYLKIDRSFIQALGDSTDLGLIPIIMAIAQTMNMHVVAEGIETPQQLAQLRSLNCDFGQGYLFSKPLDVTKVVDLLTFNPIW